MRGEKAIGAGLAALMICAVPVIVAPTSTEEVPAWAYTALRQMSQAGYVTLPEKLWTYDRVQFAALVAQPLMKLLEESPASLSEKIAPAAVRPEKTAAPEPVPEMIVEPEEPAPTVQREESLIVPGAFAQMPTPARRTGTEYDLVKKELAEALLKAPDSERRAEELRRQYQQAFHEFKRLLAAGENIGQANDLSPAGNTMLREQQAAEMERLASELTREENNRRRQQKEIERLRLRLEWLESNGTGPSTPVEKPPAPAALRQEERRAIEAEPAIAPPPVQYVPAAPDDAPAAPAPMAAPPLTAAPVPTAELLEQAKLLLEEFTPELQHLGFFDAEEAQKKAGVAKPSHTTYTKKFELEGLILYDYGQNTGPQSIGARSRFKMQLVPVYHLDNQWRLVSMAELTKVLHGLRGSGDSKLLFNRFYLDGYTGITRITAGALMSEMAEGNIYDSNFTGLRIRTGAPVKYTFEAGRTKAAKHVYTFGAAYEAVNRERLSGGLYYFDSVYGGEGRYIFALNYRRPLGALDFGLMYLAGRGGRNLAGGGGFVCSLGYGYKYNWRPGSSSGYIKYYYQPRSTYVEHTMQGMADYMNGFRGWGIGYNYMLKRDWQLSMEVYRLQDLRTCQYNNTIWLSLTYMFKNYTD